jgi:hypothetical protein
MSQRDTRPGTPPPAMGRLGFLRRLAMAAGALALGILPRAGRLRPAADDSGAAPRAAAAPALTPPAHSVKRRG